MRNSRVKVIACEDLSVGYGDLRAVTSINLNVAAGEVVALIGANGVGKTTTLLTLVGELPPLGGVVLWEGRPTNAPLHVRVRKGLAFIPEDKVIVSDLSVQDNLKAGSAPEDKALALFPELTRLLSRKAGLLSGGEKQMLTLATALAREPKAIIVDELSLGLAPLVAERLARALRHAADHGLAVLVVEQNLRRVLSLSDRFYVIRRGSIELDGSSAAYVNRIEELANLLIPGGPVVIPAETSESED
jgi:branched-chain amino acid transport system ATP-binding protein